MSKNPNQPIRRSRKHVVIIATILTVFLASCIAFAVALSSVTWTQTLIVPSSPTPTPSPSPSTSPSPNYVVYVGDVQVENNANLSRMWEWNNVDAFSLAIDVKNIGDATGRPTITVNGLNENWRMTTYPSSIPLIPPNHQNQIILIVSYTSTGEPNPGSVIGPFTITVS